ncbi:MAG: LysM peptidoglycan-binding domain-containing protein [Chlamydiia bacterium]|nr:LysM peptidoglycan-binding domain-containing protein [Chlamydiia bacterium]
MDRKKTILIAVMINAMLLVVLFVAAVTTREEVTPSVELGQAMGQKEAFSQPLFHDGVDFVAQPTAAEPLKPVEIPLISLAGSSEEPPKHKLPPFSVEGTEQTATASLPNGAVEQARVVAAPHAPLEIAVQKGDSLERIARKHHTTVDELITLNHLPSNFLKVGQRLKVPHNPTSESLVMPKSAAPSSSGKAEYYTMKVGDNPWTIAMKNHMKVDELLKLNDLNEKTARKLKPGDRLRIR